MRFDDLLKVPQALPPVPEVAARLIESFESDDVDVGSIAAQIDRDPALAAKVLQQANASFFRLLRPVATVPDATMVLGLNRVRALVMAVVLNESFKTVRGIDLDAFWRYSLGSAVLARYICGPLRLDENIAFTVGLLHGVGELVMHAAMPDEMHTFNAQVPLLAVGRSEAQYQAFGYSYAEVGAALARSWRLPAPMSDAIERHTRPLATDAPQPLAAVLHLAAWRARVFVSGNDQDLLIHTYPDDVGLLLDIDPDHLVMQAIPPLQDLAP